MRGLTSNARFVGGVILACILATSPAAAAPKEKQATSSTTVKAKQAGSKTATAAKAKQAASPKAAAAKTKQTTAVAKAKQTASKVAAAKAKQTTAAAKAKQTASSSVALAKVKHPAKPAAVLPQVKKVTTIAGLASVYNEKGTRSASGEIINPTRLTAAHRSLRFGTKVKVTNRRNGRTVVVRIIDRGPFIRGRVIDLSPAAARALGISGLAPVSLSVLDGEKAS